MQRSDFHFDLPESLIAQRPLDQRGASRLLSLDGPSGYLRDLHFVDLPNLLHRGDLLVLNDTRVMLARLFARKETGGRLEILVEHLLGPREVLAHVRSSKPPRSGGRILLEGGELLECIGRNGDLFRLHALDEDFPRLMEYYGHMPLPPYIQRPDDQKDFERYQTVYARREGAVAAPTAGLHFDEGMLKRLEVLGVGLVHVTLHVGAGTFQPVRVDNLDEHQMHAEWLEVDEQACARIRATRADGGRVVAVGTTSVRSLETAAHDGGIAPFRGNTRLFIHPGYHFRVVDAMITNFHLSESTLLMLVSAFAGYEATMAAYRHAVSERYRFFSYGDAMFLTRT